MDNKELLELAKKAMENAYAPYSKFQVGAALLCNDGTVFLGCNIENATFGATVCAERTAIFSAVASGKREFSKIAIVSNVAKTFPCGICRQVFAEFMPQGSVIVEGEKGEDLEFTVEELLPMAFKLDNK